MNQPQQFAPTIDQPAAEPRTTVDFAGTEASTEAQQSGRDNTKTLPVIPGYRITREIARGGMGRVYAARELSLDRDVAVKVLLPGASSSRFVRESRITAQLPHPYIPPVHALGTLPDGSPFLSMKLIVGQTLSSEMKTAERSRLLQAFVQVCQAVGFAHSRGVIHRDLKPSNIMVGAFGEVQVMDWGLAKEVSLPPSPHDSHSRQASDHESIDHSSDSATQTGAVLGTPAYMAPEQARGEKADARSDVFSLGGVLCAILTGHPPYRGKTTVELVKQAAAADLSEAFTRLDSCGGDMELIALCRRCLSVNPAERPADGQAVADALTVHLHSVQERLRVAEQEAMVTATRLVEEGRRRQVLYRAAAVIGLVLLLGVTGTSLGWFEATRQKESALEGWGKADKEYQRAEENFSSARNLVLNMSNQIVQMESSQKDMRQTDLARRQTLDIARKEFEQFRQSRPENERVLFQASQLHRFAANVNRLLRENNAAKDAYEQSLAIITDLHARFPNNATYRDSLALTLSDWALFNMLMGRLDQAAEELERAFQVANVAADPDYAAGTLRVTGLIRHDQAKVAYLRGKFEDSLQWAIHSGKLLEQLNDPSHDGKSRQAIDPLLAAMPLNDRAIALRETGRAAEAMPVHDEACARLKQLDDGKVSRDVVFWNCEVREQRGRTAIDIPDRRQAAVADLTQVVSIAEQLVAESPHVVHYQEKLAASYITLGELELSLGRHELAAAVINQSLTVSRKLLNQFSTASAALLVRGRAYLALGNVQAAAGKTNEARTSWTNAGKVFEIALKNDPDNYHHRRGANAAQAALKPPVK